MQQINLNFKLQRLFCSTFDQLIGVLTVYYIKLNSSHRIPKRSSLFENAQFDLFSIDSKNFPLRYRYAHKMCIRYIFSPVVVANV